MGKNYIPVINLYIKVVNPANQAVSPYIRVKVKKGTTIGELKEFLRTRFDDSLYNSATYKIYNREAELLNNFVIDEGQCVERGKEYERSQFVKRLYIENLDCKGNTEIDFTSKKCIVDGLKNKNQKSKRNRDKLEGLLSFIREQKTIVGLAQENVSVIPNCVTSVKFYADLFLKRYNLNNEENKQLLWKALFVDGGRDLSQVEEFYDSLKNLNFKRIVVSIWKRIEANKAYLTIQSAIQGNNAKALNSIISNFKNNSRDAKNLNQKKLIDASKDRLNIILEKTRENCGDFDSVEKFNLIKDPISSFLAQYELSNDENNALLCIALLGKDANSNNIQDFSDEFLINKFLKYNVEDPTAHLVKFFWDKIDKKFPSNYLLEVLKKIEKKREQTDNKKIAELFPEDSEGFPEDWYSQVTYSHKDTSKPLFFYNFKNKKDEQEDKEEKREDCSFEYKLEPERRDGNQGYSIIHPTKKVEMEFVREGSLPELDKYIFFKTHMEAFLEYNGLENSEKNIQLLYVGFFGIRIPTFKEVSKVFLGVPDYKKENIDEINSIFWKNLKNIDKDIDIDLEKSSKKLIELQEIEKLGGLDDNEEEKKEEAPKEKKPKYSAYQNLNLGAVLSCVKKAYKKKNINGLIEFNGYPRDWVCPIMAVPLIEKVWQMDADNNKLHYLSDQWYIEAMKDLDNKVLINPMTRQSVKNLTEATHQFEIVKHYHKLRIYMGQFLKKCNMENNDSNMQLLHVALFGLEKPDYQVVVYMLALCASGGDLEEIFWHQIKKDLGENLLDYLKKNLCIKILNKFLNCYKQKKKYFSLYANKWQGKLSKLRGKKIENLCGLLKEVENYVSKKSDSDDFTICPDTGFASKEAFRQLCNDPEFTYLKDDKAGQNLMDKLNKKVEQDTKGIHNLINSLAEFL